VKEQLPGAGGADDGHRSVIVDLEVLEPSGDVEVVHCSAGSHRHRFGPRASLSWKTHSQVAGVSDLFWGSRVAGCRGRAIRRRDETDRARSGDLFGLFHGQLCGRIGLEAVVRDPLATSNRESVGPLFKSPFRALDRGEPFAK
jgi:hypothetical protein